MKVINLFAGPGAGKSTTAAGLFFLMKTRGHKVELVTEYAKELVYEKRWFKLANQRGVLAEQERRLKRLVGQVDYAITDSPLLLSAIYAPVKTKRFTAEVFGRFNAFDNINFSLIRVKPYQPYGRRQSEASARNVDAVVADRLLPHVPHDLIRADEAAPSNIYERVFNT